MTRSTQIITLQKPAYGSMPFLDLDQIFLSRELLFQGRSTKLNTDETILMAGTEYFGETAVQPRDHIPVNTMRKSQSHTFAALTRLSTTTHNLLTFNISEISLGSGQSSSAILLSPNSFDP